VIADLVGHAFLWEIPYELELFRFKRFISSKQYRHPLQQFVIRCVASLVNYLKSVDICLQRQSIAQ